MSEIKDLTITSATFTVKVLRVDNHKMTKATFRQIRVKEFELWPENKYILGYVMDEDAPWLLYMCDNLLWKCPVWDWQLRISESDEELLRNNGVKWGKRAFEHYDQLFIAT